MTIIEAAEAALIDMRCLHTKDFHTCHGPDHCPTAKAIRDLELAIGETKLPQTQPEATYGGGIIVNDMDEHAVANALLRANLPPAAKVDLQNIPGIHRAIGNTFTNEHSAQPSSPSEPEKAQSTVQQSPELTAPEIATPRMTAARSYGPEVTYETGQTLEREAIALRAERDAYVTYATPLIQERDTLADEVVQRISDFKQIKADRNRVFTERDALALRVEALERALTKAAEKFEEYTRLHANKGTPEGGAKAAENLYIAGLCRAALTPQPANNLPPAAKPA